MKTQLIKLKDYNIIVSDEKIKKGDLVIALDTNIVFKCNKHEAEKPIKNFKHIYKKVIASDNPEYNLPSIDWNGLEEKYGIADVEKLVCRVLHYDYDQYKKGLYSQKRTTEIISSINAFKSAQSLNDKKFSLKDMVQAFFKGRESLNQSLITEEEVEGVIQSLQQPEIFDIEVEVESVGNSVQNGLNPKVRSSDFKSIPKVTNNKIKILK